MVDYDQFLKPEAESILCHYVEHMGTDLTVVNAARVSFGKDTKTEIDDSDIALIKYLARGMPSKEWDSVMKAIFLEHDSEEMKRRVKEIRATQTHFTPFCHPHISTVEEVPIAVERQRFKHQVGVVNNSLSLRYVDETPDVYIPDIWRKRPEKGVKQGSSLEGVLSSPYVDKIYRDTVKSILATYDAMILSGVAPEVARGILPLHTITKYRSTGSLFAYANAYKQRINSHAQYEIQQLAKQWDTIIRPLFPISWSALVDQNYD